MKLILNRHVKASFTIEAAVIVPITMIVTVALLFLAFYAHDSVVINAVSAFEIIDDAGKDGEEGSVAGDIETALSSRLITASGAAASASVSDNEITASVSADFFVRLKAAASYLTTGSRVINTHTSISNLDSRAILLKYKVMIDGVSNIAGNITSD